MILIEKDQVLGWGPTIRGMRNPMNSWAKSDSCTQGEVWCNEVCSGYFKNISGSDQDGDKLCDFDTGLRIGPNDLDLMLRLAKAGSVDGKFRRMIAVYVDITAPLYWWKEFDTYKVGTVANSCSTMHKIHAKEFTLDDFSHEHLTKRSMCRLLTTIEELNFWRDIFLNGGEVDNEDGTSRIFEPKDKDAWWQMIQLLPSSYNQKRTVMLNYEVLANIYQHRRNHKLDEWRTFCQWIEGLPYSEIITCNVTAKKPEEKATLSLKDRLVLSAYTGTLMCEFDELHKFIEETLGRPVLTHELATDIVQNELKEKLKSEFMRICGKHE